MSVKQCNATWSQVEDRIVLNISTQENELYSFWLTRNIAKHLIYGSQEVLKKQLEKTHNARASAVIQEFQKDSLKSTINFQEKFDGAANTPLGKDPLLVTGLNMSSKGDTFDIGLILANQKRVNVPLPSNMVNALVLLIEQLTQRAQWNLADDFQVQESSAEASSNTKPSEQKLH